MALFMLSSTSILSYSLLPPRKDFWMGKSISGKPAHPVQCVVVNRPSYETTVRRTANYQAPIWDYDYVQSLRSDYTGETCIGRLDQLKREVKMMLGKVEKPLDQLELIDLLQRLGISYQFEDEIKRLLNSIYCNHNIDDKWKKENLHATALEFRILRQNGYSIPQDVFSSFKDEIGDFKACFSEDIQGILCLYEASYLSIEGESILEEARDFTKKHLEGCLRQNIDENLAILVSHALELPLHWRMLRLEARWFIDAYERSQDMNPILLEFAKLDYNMVQAKHQEDLKYASRWWRSTRLGEKLSFARDRLMENFLWTVGVIFEPQFGYCRRMLTKVNAMITTIDDVYDVYGTLEELELFTDAVDRWDINAMDQLPEYMKICFLALYNSTNEMAYDLLKDQGSHIIAYLRKAWADLCKSYLLEAKWYHARYTPTLQEYLSNAWISISAPAILVHAFFFVTNPITEDALECLEQYCNIIRWSSIILRLSDDLGTSSDELKRGDVPKSIQCYMHETGACEEDAREHIKCLIGETWKKMNEDRVMESPFSQTFIGIAINLARMAQCMYQYGDGHGVQDRETKDRVLSLLIEPIPLA
ncbi:(-)-alpha-terpineol synthase-like [Vitis riparia]|uniref:(-)-alpha-terpineol synthase-like n=1 Tax=Vitis riparia TaxID=96939 RepID=UPI00155A303E|nr:(-)-alpha-terpineol synthase-like [Vitis riparia]